MDFKFYTSLFLRRLHWFLLFLIIGSAVGLTLARVLPPVYVAQAQLLAESEQIPDELAGSTFNIAANEQIQIISRRILARDTVVDLANRLDIYGGRARMDIDDLVEDMRSRIAIDTSGGQDRRGAAANATFVSIGFEAETARMSATVANELVTLFLREDVGIRTRTARQTLEFFEQEVDRLDNELAERGADILAFQEANQAALPDSLEFRRSQQAANQERILQFERDEARLKDRRARLVELYEGLGPQVQQQPAGPQTPEMRQLDELKGELAAQLLVLSPENPKIKILQTRIDALQPAVDRQIADRQAASGQAPGLSQFDIQLADIDGELEFIKLQREQANRALETLRVTIEATPSNAIALDTLVRERDNVRLQYDQAVAKKAAAETGDVIEALSKGQRISVIEQAVIPSEPERPNRLLIAGAGIGAGFTLGLAVVVLLELFNKGIRRPVDLTNKLGITPFATLPYYRSPFERRRRSGLIIGVLAAIIVGVPALLWAVDTYVMPLDLLIDRMVNFIGLAALAPHMLPTLV
jgi:uncharacterized protein involved in exopolysaccharide biosynthesis